MRRMHYADVAAAARALLTVRPCERPGLCMRLIRQAQCADAHRRETGKAHPLWGSGALMEVARCHKLPPEPGFEDKDYLDAFRLVLECVRKAEIIQRHN